MTTGLRINSPSGVLLFTDTRTILVLLGTGTTAPAGTMFTAKGQGKDYHFGLPQSASTYGLVIRDEATGAVLFDAVKYGKTAKPVGVMSGDIATTADKTVTQTFAAGRTYAVWLTSRVSNLRVRSVEITVGGTINYKYSLDDQYMSVTVSGATVSIRAWRENSTAVNGSASPVPYETAAKYDWRAVILDVTNY